MNPIGVPEIVVKGELSGNDCTLKSSCIDGSSVSLRALIAIMYSYVVIPWWKKF